MFWTKGSGPRTQGPVPHRHQSQHAMHPFSLEFTIAAQWLTATVWTGLAQELFRPTRIRVRTDLERSFSGKEPLDQVWTQGSDQSTPSSNSFGHSLFGQKKFFGLPLGPDPQPDQVWSFTDQHRHATWLGSLKQTEPHWSRCPTP
jgi:hypothetical protein